MESGTSVKFTWVIDDLDEFAHDGESYSVVFKKPAEYRLNVTNPTFNSLIIWICFWVQFKIFSGSLVKVNKVIYSVSRWRPQTLSALKTSSSSWVLMKSSQWLNLSSCWSERSELWMPLTPLASGSKSTSPCQSPSGVGFAVTLKNLCTHDLITKSLRQTYSLFHFFTKPAFFWRTRKHRDKCFCSELSLFCSDSPSAAEVSISSASDGLIFFSWLKKSISISLCVPTGWKLPTGALSLCISIYVGVFFFSCRWNFGDGSSNVIHNLSAPCLSMKGALKKQQKDVYVQDRVNHTYSFPGKHPSQTYINTEFVNWSILTCHDITWRVKKNVIRLSWWNYIYTAF